MDSLTQITLGAAVGEIALGKKVGNKAMVWGAIGGTIPDLDVVANLVTDQISAMAFHRAITHSLFFGVVAPLILGWLIYAFYDTEQRSQFWRKLLMAYGALFLLLFLGSLPMPIPRLEIIAIALVVSTAIVAFPAVLYLLSKKKPLEEPPTWKGWTLLFFLSIITHPLLDACTAYGTQLLQPFSDYRVAWNNIAVVDPIYTFPFLFFLIWASRKTRTSDRRKWLNYLGIGISSAYLLLTFMNKLQVDNAFRQAMQQQEISMDRFTTGPSIFNNILWQGVAEGDSLYHYGRYSLMDEQAPFARMNQIGKGHEYLEPFAEDRVVKILKWFSNGYYCVNPLPDGKLEFSDMRYGTFPMGDGSEVFIFQFILEPKDGKIIAEQVRPEDRNMEGAFARLWERIKGI